MAGPQHRTPEYRQARQRFGAEIANGRGWCVQPVCVMRSRYIELGMAWDVAHDDAGVTILGAAHARCNRRDGAVRGNAKRRRRWVL